MAQFQDARADVLAFMLADVPVFLWGAPGVGKSDMVRDLARDHFGGFIDWRASLCDAADVGGLPTIQDGRTVWTVPDVFPRVERDGATGVLFLDELNAAPISVQAALFGLVLNREIKGYRLPEGWRIVAAGNRQSDKAAAQRMPSALANRFAHVDVDVDVEGWREWAASRGIDPAMIAFIGFRPAYLHKMTGAPNERAFPSPRSVTQASKFASEPNAAARLRRMAALCGDDFATTFDAFYRAWSAMPDLALILREPETAPVPADSAIRYAVSSFLASKATRQNLAAIMTYACRMSRDYEISIVTDATRRDPDLKITGAFTAWAARNSDVVL